MDDGYFSPISGQSERKVTTEDRKTLSKGEYRVGITFNPSNSGIVNHIKTAAAALIDIIEGIPTNDNGERARLKALAQTAIEDGAMWAVKAATKE